MKSKKRAVFIVLIVFFLCVFLFSAYQLISILSEYKKGENVYESVISDVVVIKEPEEAPKENTTEAPAVLIPETAPIEIDFESLCAQYPDVVGWIYSPDTVINYPVVQGSDNDYYLHRLIDGTYNGSGTIFMDVANAPDLSDQNTVLYGHHMKNGSMFRSIVEYNEQEYYEEHPTLYFLTPDASYRVDIFAGYVTSATSATYTFCFADEESFRSYLEDAVSRSTFRADVPVTEKDSILTLSTCTYAYDDARYVLQGKLVKLPAAGETPQAAE